MVAKQKAVPASFVSYYTKNGFTYSPPASLLHPLFPHSFNMSAGLVQLDKKIRKKTNHTAEKMCIVQPCIRFFDIKKVSDSTHLSFFEMLGALEINDVNLIRSVKQCVEFLTKHLKLQKNRIYVTVLKTQISQFMLPNPVISYLEKEFPSHVVFLGEKENLWIQGGGTILATEHRLCGPQIEFFYYTGKQKNHRSLPDKDIIEIANIIYISHIKDSKDNIYPLKNIAIEVVYGKERIDAAREQKMRVSETENMKELTSGCNNADTPYTDIVVDHTRALRFIFMQKHMRSGKTGRNKIIGTYFSRLYLSLYLADISFDCYVHMNKQITQHYIQRYPNIGKSEHILISDVYKHYPIYVKNIEKWQQEITAYCAQKNIQTLSETDIHTLHTTWAIPFLLLRRYL